MSVEVREVRLEVYLNGAFYSDDSYTASDDKDVQLEFEITDAIYDLLGCTASQDVDVMLEVVTDDRVSIRYCSPGKVLLEVDENDCIPVCEVKDLQLEMNRNNVISELKSPEPVSEDLSDPVKEASDQGGLDAEENIPTVDLVDPEELSAQGPRVPEPEAEVTSELSSLENYIPPNVFQLEDCLRQCTLSKTPVTEVWPRVFIGNEEMARDRDKLKEMGITHILNAAAPKKNLKFLLGMASEKDLLGTVNTGSRYYRGLHITYCGLPSSYRRCFDISKYFIPAAKFIHKALRSPTSKVLIHCTHGLSHSATLFLAYLMICHDMMVEEAIDHVFKVRCIRPYFGHLRQLAFLSANLVQQRKLKLQGKTEKDDKNKIEHR